MTITHDQIPLEVKRAMRAAWARRNNSDAPEKIMADLAVAALNAWPGVILNSPGPKSMYGLYEADNQHSEVILPLPKENKP